MVFLSRANIAPKSNYALLVLFKQKKEEEEAGKTKKRTCVNEKNCTIAGARYVTVAYIRVYISKLFYHAK